MTQAALRRTATEPSPHLIGVNPISGRLGAASQAIDDHFLALGGLLGQALEGLSRLVGSLDQIGQTLDTGMVAATSAELEAAAGELMSLPGRHADRSGAMRRLDGAAERLAGDIDDMRRTLAYLRVFAINIKITAGGIASAGKEFGDFAQEIGDCIALGRTRLDAFETDLTNLRGGFKAAFDQEQVLAGRCAGLLPAVPDGLVASAQSITAHHQNIGKAAAEVAVLVRDVRKKTGSALGALQIGDITRQRVEHVNEALDMLAQVEGLSADQTTRMTAFVHRLLTAQLHAAAEDFHRDVGRIAAAMGGIARDAAEILRLRDLALGRQAGGEKGFLRQLEGHVGQALGLVENMAEADRQALRMGETVSAAAAELSAKIAELRTIKTDVQYMALNTTLKCGRLGDAGKPLAVIAVELRLHAGAMDTAAQAALVAVGALTEDAGRIVQARAADAEGGLAEAAGELGADTVGVVLSEVTHRLRTAGDVIEKDLEGLAREGDAVVAGLRQADVKMGFQDEIGAVLEQAAQALDDEAGDGRPEIRDLTGPLTELLAKIAKRYTMAQEREVHQRLTGQLGRMPPAQVARPATVEDVLF